MAKLEILLQVNKLTAIDLSKQQALDADPKAIQQLNFTTNLELAGNTTISYRISQRNYLRFLTRNCESTVNKFYEFFFFFIFIF